MTGCIDKYKKCFAVQNDTHASDEAQFASLLDTALDESCWACPPAEGGQAFAEAARRYFDYTEEFFAKANMPCAGNDCTPVPSLSL